MKTLKGAQQKLNAVIGVLTLTAMTALFLLATPPHAAIVKPAGPHPSQTVTAAGKDNTLREVAGGTGDLVDRGFHKPSDALAFAKVGSSDVCCKLHRRMMMTVTVN